MRRNAKVSFAIAALASFFAFSGQAVAAPTLTIDPNPTASYTTISGTGTVDPGDQDVSVYAEYATEPGGPWGEQFIQFLSANAGPSPVAFELTGLKAGTQYFVRLSTWTGVRSVSSRVSATTLPAAPPTATIDPVTAIGVESAHFSGEVDTATSANPFNATWSFQCVPKCPGLEGGFVSAGSSAVVEVDATGLLPGTSYEVSLIAEGPGGRHIAGSESFTTLTAAPQVSGTRAKRLVREATLLGTVYAGGAETTYHFEYGSTDSYGQSTATQTIPAGTASVPVLAKLHNLTPSTTYRYRLVASNAEGTAEGPDRSFTTEAPAATGNCPNEAIRIQQLATSLSGCRAYELVSPANKNGFPVHWKPYVGTTNALNGGMIAAARDGNAAVFTAWGVFSGSESSMPQTYRSRRTATGWRTTPGSSANNAPKPEMTNPASIPAWWTADYNLTQGVMQTSNDWSPLDDNTLEPVEYPVVPPMDVYMRGADDGNTLISVDEDGRATGHLPNSGYPPSIAGSGGHVLFQSNRHVVPEDEGRAEGTFNVYENDGSGTTLVSAAQGGGPADPQCGSYLPEVGRRADSKALAAPQSADGSVVVFQTGGERGSADFFCQFLSPAQLYLRIDGERTVHVSKSQRSEPDPGGTQAAEYIGASEDFSRIFFKSQEKLTDDTPFFAPYLYEFDVDSEELSVLLDSFTDVRAVSADGSSVIFDRNNTLFHYRNGAVTPMATTTTVAGFGRVANLFSMVIADDGRSALFSAINIVGHEGSRDTDQIFLWREGEDLQCLSCGEPGAGVPTHAHMSQGDESILAAVEPGRYADSIGADGSTVAFDTEEALLPSDSNGTRDVYEYDAAADRLSLVTDGRSEQDAFVLGVSSSGRDVFFVTAAGLASEDIDGNVDLYTARRGGGFSPPPGEPARPCSGEACQPPAALPPAAEPPISSRLSGAGNAKPRRSAACRKAKSGKRRKAAQRPGARCAKSTRKGKKKGRSSHRRANVIAGNGEGK